MIKLLKDWFEYKIKMRELKRIDKAIEKYHRMEVDLKIQGNLVHFLMRRYNEKYGNNNQA